MNKIEPQVMKNVTELIPIKIIIADSERSILQGDKSVEMRLVHFERMNTFSSQVLGG